MRQNKFNSRPYPIDLHGVRHEYVAEILEKTLLGYHNTDGYEIITGNSAHMIQIVETWLKKHDFHWFRRPHNYGRIVIKDIYYNGWEKDPPYPTIPYPTETPPSEGFSMP